MPIASIRRFAAIAAVALLASSVTAQPIPMEERAFSEHVAAQLRKVIPEGNVVVKGSLTLGVGQLQANLDRIFSFCRRDTAGCEGEIDRYVKGTAQAFRDRLAPPSPDAVRIVVRTTEYVRAARSTFEGADPSKAQIQPRAFVEGLVALPVLDTPRTIRMLGDGDNAQLGLTAQEVYELGLANVRKGLKPLMDVAKPAGRGQIGQLVGDSYHPSRLLLLDSWAPLVQAQGGVLIVAAPATDAVFYVGEDTPIAIGVLRGVARNVMLRAPNRLSGILLRWRESGWEVVPQ